ncbi:glycosyltransferase [Dactylosporangium siamense]|uniref:Glycosyltransferase family 4 protein n=1 Tax=Dactylosporangium siamense TaxID=685454 RepID=A0A919PXD9_9ACTN|nr:glycosyltransferase [Dactylosporangium siamense]GIG50268.1 hypothetical protein Dsi01nite_083090 [Dactylosporangium siamense]
MKIQVVSHDLSHNCLGRAHVLAQLVSNIADVEIIGRSADGTVWEPLRDDPSVPIRMLPPGMSMAAFVESLDADVVYAVKARRSSLGAALMARKLHGTPVIADVDDWELAFFLDNPKWLLRNAVDLRLPDNLWATIQAERQVRHANAVTVSSSWLLNRFGGTIVPHARDANAYQPHLDATKLRQELGLQRHTVILFLGSARRHKGLQSIIDALDLLGDPGIAFVHVGDGAAPRRDYVHALGTQPFHRVPQFLAAADLVVLAQQPGYVAKAQLPAKVFDAMAMQRPVIATRVSDLPAVLDGCGVLVDPGDAHGLAEAIRSIADDPDRQRRLGAAARARFEAEYSLDAVRQRVERIVLRLAGSVGPRDEIRRGGPSLN